MPVRLLGWGRNRRLLPGALAAGTEATGACGRLCGLRGGACRRQALPVIGSRPAGRWSPKWATPGSALWLCRLTLTSPAAPEPLEALVPTRTRQKWSDVSEMPGLWFPLLPHPLSSDLQTGPCLCGTPQCSYSGPELHHMHLISTVGEEDSC